MWSSAMLFCLLLMITFTATHGQHESHDHELSDSRTEKRVVKRDASLIIDSYPLESMIKRNPRVVIKRVSRGRQRYPMSKPKYGPPAKKPMKRRPNQKKYAKKPVKYPPPGYKKRATKSRRSRQKPKPKYGPPKPKYGPPKPKYGPPKPKYGPPKPVIPQTFKSPEPDGYVAPPTHPQQDILPPKPDVYPQQDIFPPNQESVYPPQDIFPPNSDNGEPPTDSYGAPLKLPINGYPLAEGSENQFHVNKNHDGAWADHSFASSNKHQVYTKPDINIDDDSEQIPIDYIDNIESNIRNPNYDYELIVEAENRPSRQKISHRFTSRPWKFTQQEEKENKILVGGQYAEPPAKYLAEDDNVVPPSFIDSEIPASATMSPYVNYKHSNMAFSPQNLNDAFSLVDK